MKKTLLFSFLFLLILPVPLSLGQTFSQAPQGLVGSTTGPYIPPTTSPTATLPGPITTAVDTDSSAADVSAKSAYGIDFVELRRDYLQIDVSQPSNAYLKAEVGGEYISSHQSLGRIGQDEQGNFLYKDLLTIQFTILVYSKFSIGSAYTYSQQNNNFGFLTLQYQNLGINLDKFTYAVSYSRIFSTISSVANGESLTIPISASFNLPLAGQTVGNYRIVDMLSYITSMRTSTLVAETGVISKTDPKYVISQSPSATKVEAESTFAEDSLAKIVSDYKLGVSSVSTEYRKDDRTWETYSMGKNSRLDTSAQSYSSSRNGQYICSIGADFYRTYRDITIKSATANIDKFGLATYTKIDRIESTKIYVPSSVGVENHYIKQNVELQVEVISPVQQITVVNTPEDIALDLPVVNNTDIFLGNSTDQNYIDAYAAPNYGYLDMLQQYGPWVIFAVVGVALIAAVIYFAPTLLSMKKAADSTKLFKF